MEDGDTRGKGGRYVPSKYKAWLVKLRWRLWGNRSCCKRDGVAGLGTVGSTDGYKRISEEKHIESGFVARKLSVGNYLQPPLTLLMRCEIICTNYQVLAIAALQGRNRVLKSLVKLCLVTVSFVVLKSIVGPSFSEILLRSIRSLPEIAYHSRASQSVRSTDHRPPGPPTPSNHHHHHHHSSNNNNNKLAPMHFPTLLTFLAAIGTTTVLASEWPIPIPQSLLPQNKDQRTYNLNPPRPENVRLIQTVEGKYQWTGDIEALLRDGVRLMDVSSPSRAHR